MSGATLYYETGFPTVLRPFPRLCAMLRELGEPSKVERRGNRIYLEWPPIFPGVPDPVYDMADPWPRETPQRRPVAVRLKQ